MSMEVYSNHCVSRMVLKEANYGRIHKMVLKGVNSWSYTQDGLERSHLWVEILSWALALAYHHSL